MTPQRLPLLQVGDVLITPDLLTEYFCCDLAACGGACCIEGDAGAPLQFEEVTEIEDALDAAWPHLSASAQAVIDKQGVAYADPDGDLVTSIVGGRDCVFTCYDKDGCCLCALEKVCREGKTAWPKPISCARNAFPTDLSASTTTVGAFATARSRKAANCASRSTASSKSPLSAASAKLGTRNWKLWPRNFRPA